MDNIFRLDNITDYNRILGQETLHPLVSVIDFSKCKPVKPGLLSLKPRLLNFGFYCIFLKDVKCGDIKYSREYYDYQEGTLVFLHQIKLLVSKMGVDILNPKGMR